MKKSDIKIVDKTNDVDIEFKNVFFRYDGERRLIILDDKMDEIFNCIITNNTFVSISFQKKDKYEKWWKGYYLYLW